MIYMQNDLRTKYIMIFVHNDRLLTVQIDIQMCAYWSDVSIWTFAYWLYLIIAYINFNGANTNHKHKWLPAAEDAEQNSSNNLPAWLINMFIFSYLFTVSYVSVYIYQYKLQLKSCFRNHGFILRKILHKHDLYHNFSRQAKAYSQK